MSSRILYTLDNRSIQIGQELGRGGEGAVFNVPTLPDSVAKIYHSCPDAKKQEKLKFMAKVEDQALLNCAAWPQEVLLDAPGGSVIGFLMPKVYGTKAIHQIYSPGERKKFFPNYGWKNLITIALNISIAFENIHNKGHVIGDVNQGNICVDPKSGKVILIDCDSFQINENGRLHLCEVGVDIFTPPELQSLKTFHGVKRTANHDNFGLALLIFHVLMGGRHPFAGVTFSNNDGSLAHQISNYQYAYASDCKTRDIEPPPGSIPIQILPENIKDMFETAFTEKGSVKGRPTAAQWHRALEYLLNIDNLQNCKVSKTHMFSKHLKQCPWCQLESLGLFFFLNPNPVLDSQINVDITTLWAQITSIPLPNYRYDIPDIKLIKVKPVPWPKFYERSFLIFSVRAISILLAIYWASFTTTFGIICLVLLVCGIWKYSPCITTLEYRKEIEKREREYKEALEKFNLSVQMLENFLKKSGSLYDKKFLFYKNIKESIDSIPKTKRQRMQELRQKSEEIQKNKFLDQYFIENHNFKKTLIGPSYKTVLRSYGIETAADIDAKRIRQIPGFGPARTAALVDWKKSLERQFVFKPNEAISQADINRVNKEIVDLHDKLVSQLERAPQELKYIKSTIESEFQRLLSVVKTHAEAAAQTFQNLNTSEVV